MRNYLITDGTKTYEVRVPDQDKLKELVELYLHTSIEKYRICNLSDNQDLLDLFETEENKNDERCFIIEDNGQVIMMDGLELQEANV